MMRQLTKGRGRKEIVEGDVEISGWSALRRKFIPAQDAVSDPQHERAAKQAHVKGGRLVDPKN